MRISRGAARGELLTLVDHGTLSEPDDAPGASAEASDDFDGFYRREFAGLVVLARVLGGPALAADAAQEAMLVAFRRWDEVQLLGSPAGWVRAVCLRKAASVVRRRGLEQRVLRSIGSFRSGVVRNLEDDDRFWRELLGLPSRQAQVVAMHYVLGLGVSEIAEALACAAGTVEAHLSHGRTALARSWQAGEVAPGTSVDSELRRKGRSTLEAVAAGLDVEERLDELGVAMRRRRNVHGVFGLLAAAATVAAVAGLVPLGEPVPADVSRAPAPAPAPSASASVEPAPQGCVGTEVVACLEGGTVLIRGSVPYTFKLPEGFAGQVTVSPGRTVDVAFTASADAGAGSRIVEKARAADSTDHGTTLDARRLAQWVATLTYVHSSPVEQGTIDGRVAWSLQVEWPPGADRAGVHACNSVDSLCRSILRQTRGASRWDIGASAGSVNRLTFLDVPGMGTVVLWSWADKLDLHQWSEAEDLLASVHFRRLWS